MHPSHSGDERRERAHDGDEAGEDDGLAAVFPVKCVRLVQMAPFENPGVWVGEEFSAEESADRVIAGVARDGRGEEDGGEQVCVHRCSGLRRDGARHEQQRVAGQERRDDQSGLAEDDGEEDGVSPQMVLLDDAEQVLVDM